MPRLKKVPCAHCDAKIVSGISFCTNCEQPTAWASRDERTTWELRQWQEKRPPRIKRTSAPVVAEVTPIRARRVSTPRPLTPHPASVKAGLVKAAPVQMGAIEVKPEPASVKGAPTKRVVGREITPSTPAPKISTPKVRAPKVAAPDVSAPKKQVAVSKPEPARASAKPLKSAPKAVSPEQPVAQPAATMDLTEAPSGQRDPAIEQVELLRELLQRVISIEEKMTGNGTGLSRRLRLLKR
jgi:hypothetical protein